MKDIRRDEGDWSGRAGGDLAVSEEQERAPEIGKRSIIRCSICRKRAWLDTTYFLEEPPGVPDPHQSWMLCKRCHAALQIEMERSPVLSPLRLRIAVGIVAAERSPDIYAPTRQPISDRTWIVVMAWGFAIAMVLHLAIIVMLAFVAGH